MDDIMRKIDYSIYYKAKPDSIGERDNMHSVARVGCDSHSNRSESASQESHRSHKFNSEANRKTRDMLGNGEVL